MDNKGRMIEFVESNVILRNRSALKEKKEEI